MLGFCCAKGDWTGALTILDNNQSAGLIDKATYRRQRGVLLTARALELQNLDRDLSRESVMEAVKLAPTLVPAAVLASKFESEAHQVRRSMRLVETAWLSQPHPDLADAYAHVKLGDSARQRLVRVETLAAKAPGHIEGALAIARAAIDAAEFGKARAALEPFVAAPTQRVAMLMAEIERTEHGDSGRARAWTCARCARGTIRPGPRTAMSATAGVRCRRSPAGSTPSSGRRRWRACRPTRMRAIEPSPFEEAMLATPRRAVVLEPPVADSEAVAEGAVAQAACRQAPVAPQDNAPPAVPEPVAAEPAPAAPIPAPAPRRHRRPQPNQPRPRPPRCSGPARTSRRPRPRRSRP